MNMNPDAKSRSTQPIVIECRRLAEVTGSWFSPKKWLRFRVTRYLLPTPASEPTSHYALFSCPDCGNKVRIYSIRPGDWDINRFTWLVTSGIALFLSILFLVACACGAFISVIQGPRVLVASLIHDTSLGLIAVFVSLALTCFLVAIRFFRLAWSGRIAGPIVGYHRVVCGPTLPFFGGTGMNPFVYVAYVVATLRNPRMWKCWSSEKEGSDDCTDTIQYHDLRILPETVETGIWACAKPLLKEAGVWVLFVLVLLLLLGSLIYFASRR